MAMLAEKKKREKWCLNPRGKAWSDDQTKFGQRLLEKMGWSAGQGLGVNNQGPTDIVKVRKKDDSKGLGFKENGEEWLKTTSEFNELLDQLGSGVKNGGGQADVALSLEDRSKKSKARVHYHKFTRGKDLSRYSEKDLASIIGPEVVKAKSAGDENDPDYSSNQVNMGSSAEYFNSKKKSKHDQSSQLNSCEEAEDSTVESEYSNKISKKDKISIERVEHSNIELNPEEIPSSKLSSKKNKNKKILCSNENINKSIGDEKVSKKKRKIQNVTENITNTEKMDSFENEYGRFEKVSKKKEKNILNNTETTPAVEKIENSQCFTIENVEVGDDKRDKISKKKKKERTNGMGVMSNLEQDGQLKSNQESGNDEKVSKKKKKQNGTPNKSVMEQGEDENLLYKNHEGGDEQNISRKRKGLHESYNPPHLDVLALDSRSAEVVTSEKLTKKNKKSLVKFESSLEEVQVNSPAVQGVDNEIVGSEKVSKKKKKMQEVAMCNSIESNTCGQSEEICENIETIGNDVVSKKKKKKIEDESTNSAIESNTCVESEEMSENIGTISNDIVSKKKKKKIEDESTNSAIESNTCVQSEEMSENIGTISNDIVSKKKKKKKKIEDESTNSAIESNPCVQSEEMSENIGTVGVETVLKKKKKKKIQDVAIIHEHGIEEENSSSLITENQEIKHKRHKKGHDISVITETSTFKELENPESSPLDRKLKKKRKREEQTNLDCINSLEEETPKSKKSKNKSKKNKTLQTELMNEELKGDETVILTEQPSSFQESKDCLVVMGRKTRLKKINMLDNAAKNKKYSTEEFMAFNTTDLHGKPERFSSNGAMFKQNPEHESEIQNHNNKWEKIYIDPKQEGYNIPKRVVMYEYRLLTQRANKLNIIVPMVKVIIKDALELPEATRKTLKILHKSRHIKSLLPENDLFEIEASVKRFADELQPKIDMINAVVEIEKKTESIMDKFVPTEKSDSCAEDSDKGKPPDQIGVLKNISKQLKLLLEEQSNPVREKHPERYDKESYNSEQKADSPQGDEVNKSRDQVNSLQTRLETKLKMLAEKMEALKRGKKPLVIQPLQFENPSGKKLKWQDKLHKDNINAFRSRGTRRGGMRSSPFLSAGNDHEGTLQESGGHQRGRCSGRGFTSAVPAGGWGILRSYGEAHEGKDSVPHFTSRSYYIRGGRGDFRGRGRRGDLRGRGRISQNNYDAKVYAAKCKELNKVPELAFSGVDLKIISGYAANTSALSAPQLPLETIKKPSGFSEVVVEKNESLIDVSVKNECQSRSQ